MSSCSNPQHAIPQEFKGSPGRTRHYSIPGKIAKISKTDVSRKSHHDVIENFDFQELARSDQITGDLDVRLRWSRIPTRMVVRDYNSGSTRHNSKPKDLPGMAENCIHRPNGHQIMPLDAPTRV